MTTLYVISLIYGMAEYCFPQVWTSVGLQLPNSECITSRCIIAETFSMDKRNLPQYFIGDQTNRVYEHRVKRSPLAIQ